MIATQLSTCLTVEDFFSQANWQGLNLTPTTIQQTTTTISVDQVEKPHMGLSVTNFFARNNWRGRRQMTAEVLNSNQEQVPTKAETKEKHNHQ